MVSKCFVAFGETRSMASLVGTVSVDDVDRTKLVKTSKDRDQQQPYQKGATQRYMFS